MNGHISRHQCLLVGSHGMAQERFEGVNTAAKRAFADVKFIQTPGQIPDVWPVAPNTLFRCAAGYIAETVRVPWLWMEPDAIPLRPEWADRIETDYIGARKPFMGTRFDAPYPHINGIAVYPPDIRSISPKMFSAHTKPFDLIDAKLVMSKTQITKLIHHRWGDIQNNIAPTFPNMESLKSIPMDTMVFHRNKDGTLIQRLRERSGRRHYDEMGRLNNCIVQLGRYGDIMNVLPIAKFIKDNYAKPYLMASREFIGLLEGVSYVIPVEFEGDYSRVSEAMAIARTKFEHILPTQVWGDGVHVEHQCGHYNQESWRMAGFLDRWSEPRLKLVFDKRNSQREAKLIRQNLRKNAKPIMLINLSGGHSGPFSDWQIFQFDLVNRWERKYQVVDLSSIIAHQVYDLLGLFEMADVLVTIDTSTLHLSCASEIPVIALLNDKTPWNQTLLRRSSLASIPYSQAMTRIEEVHMLIKNL